MHSSIISNLIIGENYPVRVMGVINCSPESFFLSSYTSPGNIYDRAVSLIEGGADLIDLGARSTAPNSPLLPVHEEIERVKNSLAELKGTDFPLSLDTTRPEVLSAALHYDIHAINDISGLSDPVYAKIVEDSGLPPIVMASKKSQGDPRSFEEVMDAMNLVGNRCSQYNIDNFILDPGIGRWSQERDKDLDIRICTDFALFKRFFRPLLGALSRKTFIGEITKRPPESRLAGSLAFTMIILYGGANIIRTHDVPETVDCIKVFEATGKKE